MNNVLIIGATSAIAEATAKQLAQRGCTLYLIARNAERLQSLCADLSIRGAAAVHTQVLDLDELDKHPAALEKAFTTLQTIDLALIAHGSCPEQEALQQHSDQALAMLHTNTLSSISLLGNLATMFQQQGHGCIAAISSVAGDRGRQSNYIYGASKAALTTYLQGLRHRMHRYGVNVLTIKPGLVDTPMTAEFNKGPLWASADTVATDILRAVTKGRRVLYTPWFWRPIMRLICHIPEPLFLKTRL